MRTFVDLILNPPKDGNASITSVTAIAAVVLDDAGLDPDALKHGLTLIECCDGYVSNAIVNLVSDALQPADVSVDQRTEFDSDTVAVFTGEGLRDQVMRGIERAVAADIPVVAVLHPDRVLEELDDVVDRDVVVPTFLDSRQLARIVEIVCPPKTGEEIDVAGAGDCLTLFDAVKCIRRGFPAALIAERLRKSAARKRPPAQPEDVVHDAEEVAKAFAQADEAKAPEAKAPVRLRDLSGYGAAKDWGMQLAEDVAAYKRGEIGWEDLDKGILLSGPPGCGKTFFASALAAECGVKLEATTYSDWSAPSLGGDSVTRTLKKLFEGWRKQAAEEKCLIVFIDEIDSIGTRGENGHNEFVVPSYRERLACVHGRGGPAHGRDLRGRYESPGPSRRCTPARWTPGEARGASESGRRFAGRRHQAPRRRPSWAARGGRRLPRAFAGGYRAGLPGRPKDRPAGSARAVRGGRRPGRRGRRARGALSGRRWCTVFHECGHALVGSLLGIDLKFVDADSAHNAFRPPAVMTMEGVQRDADDAHGRARRERAVDRRP